LPVLHPGHYSNGTRMDTTNSTGIVNQNYDDILPTFYLTGPMVFISPLICQSPLFLFPKSV
jgi:hypothetical protein